MPWSVAGAAFECFVGSCDVGVDGVAVALKDIDALGHPVALGAEMAMSRVGCRRERCHGVSEAGQDQRDDLGGMPLSISPRIWMAGSIMYGS